LKVQREKWGRVDESDVYDRIGEEGFARLIRAFYAQVPADDILAPMYPKHDLDGAEQRLRDFLIGRFGGPQRYIEQRGHPRLRMRHAPFAIGPAERDAWLARMKEAVDRLELPPEYAEPLWAYLHGAAFAMQNTP
jgi:hemoglobin